MTRRAAPSYEEIADAMQDAFDSSLIEILATQDGRDAELWQVARCLDKAGLIDWTGVGVTGCPSATSEESS
jgi:hypothetical protein